jgi:prostaglandin-H2 D-isomerase / glutathione transferase
LAAEVSDMPKLKLSYFDFHGGRGEPARLALAVGGIPFEDDRVGADWSRRKGGTAFGSLPVLEVDGQVLTQSNAINRYVGRLANLYPNDAWQAALCDETMDAVEDIGTKISLTLFIADEQEKRAKRKALADGPIAFFLERLSRRLVERGGEYFADNRLTVADLKVFVWVRHLRSGNLDHVPTDLPDRIAPKLVEHFARVERHPAVREYYTRHGITPST